MPQTHSQQLRAVPTLLRQIVNAVTTFMTSQVPNSGAMLIGSARVILEAAQRGLDTPFSPRDLDFCCRFDSRDEASDAVLLLHEELDRIGVPSLLGEAYDGRYPKISFVYAGLEVNALFVDDTVYSAAHEDYSRLISSPSILTKWVTGRMSGVDKVSLWRDCGVRTTTDVLEGPTAPEPSSGSEDSGAGHPAADVPGE